MKICTFCTFPYRILTYEYRVRTVVMIPKDKNTLPKNTTSYNRNSSDHLDFLVNIAPSQAHAAETLTRHVPPTYKSKNDGEDDESYNQIFKNHFMNAFETERCF